MAATPHPQANTLRRAMERCLGKASAWNGIIYRFASIQYATRTDLLSGKGSKKCGGRWNPIGQFETIYGSTMAETALEESLAHYRYYAIPDYKALPRILVAIQVGLASVLDLTDGDVRRRLGVSAARMLSVPWRQEQDQGREALTQAIGRMAFEVGLEGLRVPSAASRKGEGLVIFPGNCGGASILRIVNASQLTR